jgi:integrase/recombinase XerD
MSTDTTVSPLRQRMIEDMAARKLGRHAQRSHIHSCRRFAAFLGRSPDTATADDVRRFRLHLVESGLSIPNRNRIMTGVRFLFRVTLRRHDLAAEVYHLKEPQKLPLVMSPEEAKRLLTMSGNLKVHVMLALDYGCGLRAGEIVRLRAGDIDSAQMIIRIVQGKGRKDRHVMLPPEVLALLREANRGHVSLDQLKVMSAIERCRTAALGGHVARCENDACAHTTIAYNSCLMGRSSNGELEWWFRPFFL